MGYIGQHPAESVVVSWAEEPEEWLWPLVIAVHESASRCIPPGSEALPSRQAVLRISFAAPGPAGDVKAVEMPRILQHASMSRTSFEEAKLNYVADDFILRFPSRPLLQTRLGLWLHSKGWLQRVCLIVFLFLLLLIYKPPMCRVEHVPDAAHDVDLPIRVRSVWGTASILLVQMFFFSLVFQRMNRCIFVKAFWSFECLMLIGNFVLSEVADMYHMLNALSTIGALKVMDVVACFIYLGTSVWWGVGVATVDAWMISRRQKTLFVGLAGVVVLGFWLRYAYQRRWSSASMCLYSYCVKPKHVAIAAFGNLLMFIAKLVWAYISGWPFANLKTYYVEPRHGWPLSGGTSKPVRQAFACCRCCTARSRGGHATSDSPRRMNVNEPAIASQAVPPPVCSGIARNGEGCSGDTVWNSDMWTSTSTPALLGRETTWQRSRNTSGGAWMLESGASSCPTFPSQCHDDVKQAADMKLSVSSCPTPFQGHDERHQAVGITPQAKERLVVL